MLPPVASFWSRFVTFEKYYSSQKNNKSYKKSNDVYDIVEELQVALFLCILSLTYKTSERTILAVLF